jgi:hypothetical protein
MATPLCSGCATTNAREITRLSRVAAVEASSPLRQRLWKSGRTYVVARSSAEAAITPDSMSPSRGTSCAG